MSKDIPETHKFLDELPLDALLIRDFYTTLDASPILENSLQLRKISSGKGHCYLQYLVDNFSFEEFKQIWEAHSPKLEKIVSHFNNPFPVDVLFLNEQYDYVDFLVKKGFNLGSSGYHWGVATFNFNSASAKADPLNHMDRYLQILEKQSYKYSSKKNLILCLYKILSLKNQDVMLGFLNHPYVKAEQLTINDRIKSNKDFVLNIPCFSQPLIWEYFLTRVTLSPRRLEKLVDSAVKNKNLPFLLYLENKKLYEFSGSDLAKATKFQCPDIITHLIVEKKIDPLTPIKGTYPFCEIPEDSSSTAVIDAYAKGMGSENLCNMLLKKPVCALSFLSQSYGTSPEMSRENSIPVLAAKIYILENAPIPLRMQFKFGETLTSIISDETYLDLLCAAYHDDRCVHIRDTLDHFISFKETLLVYRSHKSALGHLKSRLTAPSKLNTLSDEGLQEVSAIVDQLREADMQMSLAKGMASDKFKKAEDRPEAASLDWRTKKAAIKNPENLDEINVERAEARLPLLGVQPYSKLLNTRIESSLSAGWYEPLPAPAILQESVSELVKVQDIGNKRSKIPAVPSTSSSHAKNPQTLFSPLESTPKTRAKTRDDVWELSCCQMAILGCIPVVGWAILLTYAIYHSCCAPADDDNEDRVQFNH